MERRTFVRLSTYTAMALTLPLVDGCSVSKEKAISQPLFFSHLVDAKSIKETGNSYRKMTPAENNKISLTELLLGKSNTETDAKSIQNTLNSQVEQDFKTGKTVMVKGWVLSVTEARQCALYSILNA
ncbi:MAG TPA: hypothetical protein VK668_03535 [Mucilaginibacter sp.]|nr:hypothetical protein [Mucilaginibacter sp.]